MKITGDYHTHTKASDGRSTVTQNAAAAIARGLDELVISDHGCTSLFCHVTEDKLRAQREEIDALNAQGGLRIYGGVEANILGDGTLDVPDDIIAGLDVLLCGFHRFVGVRSVAKGCPFVLVNGWASERERIRLTVKNTDAYLKALQSYPIDILCHLGHRCIVDIGEVCRAAAEKGVYVELNEKHIETLEAHIDAVMDSGVKLILGSDAHRTDRVGRFARAEACIKKYGIPKKNVIGAGAKPVFGRKDGR